MGKTAAYSILNAKSLGDIRSGGTKKLMITIKSTILFFTSGGNSLGFNHHQNLPIYEICLQLLTIPNSTFGRAHAL